MTIAATTTFTLSASNGAGNSVGTASVVVQADNGSVSVRNLLAEATNGSAQVSVLGKGNVTVESGGVVEAVSGQVNGAPVLAVQWHPEWRTDANPQSQTFFQIFGRALRGAPLVA